jgi:cytidylate kinase
LSGAVVGGPPSGRYGQESEPSTSADCSVGPHEKHLADPSSERPRPFIVAIDGPAASGKGTLARHLAKRFGLAHLETGALYRATALLVLEEGGDPADAAAAGAAARRVDAHLLLDPRLRGEDVAHAASVVAANPDVRRALLDFQRSFAAHPRAPARGAVLDGRDIGSVVCPAADVKLFITADAEVRARRRLDELQASGSAAIYEDVLRELKDRDTRDAGRGTAPMAVPPDATVVDTTALDVDAVLARVSDMVSRAIAGSR